jgi:hypothetical protein
MIPAMMRNNHRLNFEPGEKDVSYFTKSFNVDEIMKFTGNEVRPSQIMVSIQNQMQLKMNIAAEA